MIRVNKKAIITLGLTAAIMFGALASMPPEPEKAKNLKVLPKNLTHDQIETVMRQWTRALGVRCNFCHARGADGRNDFASDAKPEKLEARDMYKMAEKINKKYFKAEKDSLGMTSFKAVACITCHHGSPHPDNATTAAQGQQGGQGFGPGGQRPQGQAPGQGPGQGGQGGPGQRP